MATSSKAKKKTVRLASGRKRARQDVALNAHNSSLGSHFRTVIKNVQKAVAAGAQLDCKLVLFSTLSSTLSFGYAVAAEKNQRRRTEWMVSLKLL